MRNIFADAEDYRPLKKARWWLAPRAWIAAVCLGTALYYFGSAGYLLAKAWLAQRLIAGAWESTLSTGQAVRPWSWADTWPVAKLSVSEKELYVLEGASGRVLAFGPGHLAYSALAGEQGNTVIVGHKDTHFAVLEELQQGQEISLQTDKGQFQYRITELRIAHESQTQVMQQTSSPVLTLITCYPFDSITANTPYRYLVRAELVSIR